jgi:hypothetical protein
MRECILITLAVAALVANNAYAQVPTLADGSDTYWVVDQTEEIVTYVLFDPATVMDSLPSNLRFITIGELATAGVRWAEDYLTEEPSRGPWGISFLEIARMGTFMIDGHAPDWPQDGAIALWAARVAPSDSSTSLSPGRPLLVLGFWLPDSQYVTYMRDKGHYATFGDVKLRQDPSGKWWGSIGVDGLSVVADCTSIGPVTGGTSSSGMQTLFPPKLSAVTSSVRVAFAGHQIQTCKEDSSWKLEGTHALARGVPWGPSTFQFGYHLVGRAIHP